MIRKLLVAAFGVAALAACSPAADDNKAETTEGAMAPAADDAMAPAPAADGAMAADDKMAPAQ